MWRALFVGWFRSAGISGRLYFILYSFLFSFPSLGPGWGLGFGRNGLRACPVQERLDEMR